MRDQPPDELIALLDELGLASSTSFLRARWYVRRLARGLPAFASVWVDALAQARVLTPHQASEINAERGAALACGPYVIRYPLPSAGWAQAVAARHRETGELVRLLIATCTDGQAQERAERFARQLAAIEHVACEGLTRPTACGHDGDRFWCAQPWVEGPTAAAWCSRRGRMPPAVVLEIARQMANALAALARFELAHGDVSTHNLVLQGESVILVDALFRAAARPREGFTALDVPPEALDYLAPEQARDGRPPDHAADIYACGLVWWHLLSGRPPLAGGNSLTKLQAACLPRIVDIGSIAPDVSPELAEAIAHCLQGDPARRPTSFAELATRLGRSMPRAQRMLAEHFGQVGIARPSTSYKRSRALVGATAGVAALALAIVFAPQVSWLGFRSPKPSTPAPQLAQQTDSANPAPPVNQAAFTADEPQITIEGATVRLPAGRVKLERLKLKPGQIVSAPPGARTICEVGGSGLLIDGAKVRFENIDFVHASREPAASRPPLVHLQGGEASFTGCTFNGSLDERAIGPAIVWSPAPGGAAAEPEAGRIEFTDCVFRAVRNAVAVEHEIPLAMICRNVLYLGPGPAVRLHAAPRFETPAMLSLTQFTLRDAAGVVELPAGGQQPADGTLRIEMSQTVFAPPAGTALVTFAGGEPSEPAAQGIAVRGDSSVVQPGVMLVAWRDARQTLRPLRDDRLSVQGLVRGAVEFAGPARGPAANSQLTRWQVPLVAEEPPGIDPRRLPAESR